MRALLPRPLVIACRIHQVAYVENLKPLAPIELLNGSDQADVAFLDQIDEVEAAARVSLRDRYDESQIGADERCFGLGAGFDLVCEMSNLARSQPGFGGEYCRRSGAGLDGACQAHLIVGVQENVVRHLVEVYPNGIGRVRSRYTSCHMP